MTKIRVDPPVLQNCSQDIRSNASTIASVSGNLDSCANGAPSYDGQFGPKVRSIVAEVTSRGGQLSVIFNNFSSLLGTKAQQFLNADYTYSGLINSIYSNNLIASPISSFFSTLRNLPFLSFLNNLFPEGINIWNSVPGNLTTSGTSPSTVLYNIVSTAGVNLRSGAGLDNSILTTIKSGTNLQVIGFGIQMPDGYTWIRVRTPDGKIGWVADKYTRFIDMKPTNTNVVKENSNSATTSKSNQNNNGGLVIGLKQNDTKWAKDEMGDGTGGTIEQYGCLITTITMLGRFYGADITPKDTNKWLRENGGYTKGSSYLVWDQAKAFLNETLKNKNNIKNIKTDSVGNLLEKGTPVILHVPGPTEDGHWVLGFKSGDNSNTFKAYDPWTGSEKEFNYSSIKEAKISSM